MKAITQIRSVAITKANHLQRAHRHLEELRPAFADWAAGEIYVCKKTGDFRYRFGELSKSITPWNKVARGVFPTPAAFAFAAMVLAEDAPKPAEAPVPLVVHKLHSVDRAESKRANVVDLAA